MGERPASGDHVFFSGEDRLEGILEWPHTGGGEGGSRGSDGGEAIAAVGGVVIAHPHPLYGGTMAQPVVYRVAQACRRRGMATLRFNFRGVGESRGTYSGTAEYRDVEAAAHYLRGRLVDTTPGRQSGTVQSPATAGREGGLALAGYSFGSAMAAMAAKTQGVVALALVAYVVGWDEMPREALERLAGFEGSVLAVCGDRDELAAPRDVEKALSRLGVDFSLTVIEGADHFFEDRQREVGERVAAFFETSFANR